MHVRLKRRWASMPDTLYAGGWYPVVNRLQYKPTGLDDVVFKVEDEEMTMSATDLVLTDEPRTFAVWGIGRPAAGGDPGGGGAVICPQGHAIVAVAPWAGRARCGKCAAWYEIASDGPQLPLK